MNKSHTSRSPAIHHPSKPREKRLCLSRTRQSPPDIVKSALRNPREDDTSFASLQVPQCSLEFTPRASARRSLRLRLLKACLLTSLSPTRDCTFPDLHVSGTELNIGHGAWISRSGSTDDYCRLQMEPETHRPDLEVTTRRCPNAVQIDAAAIPPPRARTRAPPRGGKPWPTQGRKGPGTPGAT